jgi:hypothetical protein
MNRKWIVRAYAGIVMITLLQVAFTTSIARKNVRQPLPDLFGFLQRVEISKLDAPAKAEVRDLAISAWYTWLASNSIVRLDLCCSALALALAAYGLNRTLRASRQDKSGTREQG